MQSLVVFLALAAVARASLLPLAQPPHHPAIVLDPHGRPLDTAEVIGARALHLQAKALEHGYLSPLAHSVAAPAWGVHSAIASPLLAHSGLLGHGHYLKKRSLGHWGSVIAPASSSYSQSSVDIVHPSVYSHAVAAPVLSHAVSPIIAHSAPAWGVHSAIASPLLAHSGLLGHGHLLKKRSLGHWGSVIAPASSSYSQSSVDIVHPSVYSHAVAAPVLSHAVSPIIAHSAPAWGVHSAIASPLLAHSGLLGHGHLLKKRSLGHWGSVIAPASSSYSQSSVDIVHPSVYSHAVAAPVLAHAVAAPVLSHAVAPVLAHAGPVVAHAIPTAVSHQSRVDLSHAAGIYGHGLHGW